MKKYLGIVLAILCLLAPAMGDEGAEKSATGDDGAKKSEFTEKQYFIDSAQMLTECLYAVKKTGRFDLVENQILSNAKIGKIPLELKSIAKRIIDTCQQGRIALNSQAEIDADFGRDLVSIGIRAGIRIGTAAALEDPVGAIWAVCEGGISFSKATSQNNQRIRAVLLQQDYRIKSDMYDLRNLITDHAAKYGVDSSQIIAFSDLEEIEKMLPSMAKNPAIIDSFIARFPYYDKLKYYAVKHHSKTQLKMLATLLGTKNSILNVDKDRLNACAAFGNSIIWAYLSRPDSRQSNELMGALILVTNYGLKNGGHSSPVFYFMRGVVNSMTQFYNLKKMSEDDIWKDLLISKELDAGEYMNFQSWWCASYLAASVNEDNKEQLKKYLLAALKIWKPSPIVASTLFERNEVAKEVYREVFKVSWAWWIDWGWFDDDIILRNKSPFDLRNIKLSVKIMNRKTEEVVWEKELTCPLLRSGKTHKWTDVMSIKNGSSSLFGGKAKLRCDEMVLVRQIR